MRARLRDGVASRLQRFISRRAPADGLPLTLGSRRIYILPTRNGLYFAVLVVAMLLGSMNYNNSLGFALAFLLAAVGLVAMHHTQRNLLRLEVRRVSAAAVFAGDDAIFRVELANDSRLARHAIRVGASGLAADAIDIGAGQCASAALRCATTRRGTLDCPRLRIDTVYPMGLFNAWSWLAVEASVLVYPRPAGAQALPAADSGDAPATQTPGESEFAGHRAYVAGDSPRRIDWKASARTDALIVSHYTDAHEHELWLDVASLAHLETEACLSQLTRWVLTADADGLRYGLRLPGAALAPAVGRAHKRNCLTALALA